MFKAHDLERLVGKGVAAQKAVNALGAGPAPKAAKAAQVAPAKTKDLPDLSTRDLSWFAERVARGQKEVFSETVTITPAIAFRLLEANEENRRENPRKIREIAHDIERGLWQLNGEAIIVSKDGKLNDGQMRLNAIVMADKAVQSIVTFGVTRDSRMTVDMGSQRTNGNFFQMSGILYANNASATMALYGRYMKGVYSGKSGGVDAPANLTKQEIRGLYHRYDKIADKAMAMLHPNKWAMTAGVNPLGAAYIILKQAHSERAEQFFAKVLAGADLAQSDPILWLRNVLMEMRGRRLRSWEKLELILRHWNAWIEGREMERRISLRGEYPKVTVPGAKAKSED